MLKISLIQRQVPSTYNSFKTNAIANQNSSIQATNSDPTIAGTVATG